MRLNQFLLKKLSRYLLLITQELLVQLLLELSKL